MTETRPIGAIRVGQRFRRDMGDLSVLATSIRELGLLHPLVVSTDSTLIVGARRLEACRLLGWPEVPVRVVNLEDPVRAEFHENTVRKDFLPSEAVAIAKAVEDLEGARARARQGTRTDLQHLGKLPTSERGRAADKIAALAGCSRRTLEKAREVVEAAEREPERFSKRLQDMDRTGKVHTAWLLVRRAQRAEQAGKAPALESVGGGYQVILADPPWRYEFSPTISRAAENQYETMPLDDICALPMTDIAAPDAVLFLWVPPAMVVHAAHQVLEAWGFKARAQAVWVKPSVGTGFYFRNRHENLILAVRGTPPVPASENVLDSVIEAPRGRHSEKPAEVHERIERMYPGWRKVELFARQTRRGWTAWGDEIVSVAAAEAAT